MPRTATTTSADRLLHCSPDRTLFVTTDPLTGARTVAKVFVRGSLVDAEREVTMGRFAAHLGVVQYRSTGTDPTSSRPCVFAELHEGTDLDRLVAEFGAMPAARAAALLQPVAATLAAMHALRTPALPHGLCHGDVKPKNLLATTTHTLLLDFEHASPIGATAGRGEAFTGGTLGFAPPEASHGASPNGAFDVYGLGATLRWLLTGGGRALPQDPDVERLVQACLAPNPDHRPSAAMVAEALADLESQLRADPAEAALALCATGEPGRAEVALSQLSAGPRRSALERLAARANRVLRALPHLLQVPDAEPTEPGALRRELTTAQRVLRLFPRHPATLRWRQRLTKAIGELLARAAEHTATLRRAEEFDAAAAWLDESIALASQAQKQPGGCPIPSCDDPRSAGPLQRATVAFLQQQRHDLDSAREDLAAQAREISTAEERLDLTGAELAIDRMAAHYGGASPTAARRRDQLHRLAFYLQRIARAHTHVERLGQLWDAVALEPLLRFVTACASAATRAARNDQQTGPVGLRSLQVTLVNLIEEFPHLFGQADPALEALTGALEHTTDQCWELLPEAQQKLQSVPVPVRPLQLALGRLDTFRILEAFVDRPSRPRSQLLDGIESLRLALEQARATRDRLAHGAEQALARGHWTTGLFDMERAVAGLNQGDERDHVEAQRLRDRLAEAKRRKQEIEAAVRRNVELGGRYSTLQDEATSSFASRLQVLAERRDCLHFLAMHLQADRGVLYGRDLREVETQIALEQAGLAENELDGTEEPFARLRISRATLDRLGASITVTDLGNELPGRLQRLLEHWRTVTTQCQREVERVHDEQQARQRQRRRLLAMACGAALVSLLAIGFAARPWLFGEATAAERSAGGEPLAAIVAAPDAAIAALVAQSLQLPAPLQERANRVTTALAKAHNAPDPLAWHAEFAAALSALATPRGSNQPADLFLAAAWRTGVLLVLSRADQRQSREIEAATTQLAAQMQQQGQFLEPTFAKLAAAAAH